MLGHQLEMSGGKLHRCLPSVQSARNHSGAGFINPACALRARRRCLQPIFSVSRGGRRTPALLARLRNQPLIGTRIGCAFSGKQEYLRLRANADAAGDISILGILTQAGN